MLLIKMKSPLRKNIQQGKKEIGFSGWTFIIIYAYVVNLERCWNL